MGVYGFKSIPCTLIAVHLSRVSFGDHDVEEIEQNGPELPSEAESNISALFGIVPGRIFLPGRMSVRQKMDYTWGEDVEVTRVKKKRNNMVAARLELARSHLHWEARLGRYPTLKSNALDQLGHATVEFI